MHARVNHFTGNKLHLLHLNCYSKMLLFNLYTVSIGFALVGFFLLHTDMHIYRVRNETFCFSHGDCVMHRVTQQNDIGVIYT